MTNEPFNNSQQSCIQNRLPANLSVAALAKTEASATAGESCYLRAHEALLQVSRILYKSAIFLQNKANVKIGKINISIAIIKDYDKNREQ